MKNNINVKIVAAASAAIVLATAALPLFANAAVLGTGLTAGVSVGANASVSATLAARIANIKSRGDQEITRRITALTALNARVGQMQKLSASEQSALSASIQAQITAMTGLQSKLDADATADSTSSLKSDVASITGSYRIFALILPQGAIEALSDRALTIQSLMTNLSAKFQTRISEAQTAGNDVSAAQATLADFNAKVSDAGTQATAANAEVESLTPDNGNQAQLASNTAALKDARAKLKVSEQDYVSARADAQTLVTDLKSFKVSASASATTSASTSVQ